MKESDLDEVEEDDTTIDVDAVASHAISAHLRMFVGAL